MGTQLTAAIIKLRSGKGFVSLLTPPAEPAVFLASHIDGVGFPHPEGFRREYQLTVITPLPFHLRCGQGSHRP